jgi:phosphoesterase RecJ-like protein
MEFSVDQDRLIAFLECFGSSKNIVITTHKSPDGDAVGSSLALVRLLEKLGKNVCGVLPDTMPGFLEWLPGSSGLLVFEQNEEEVEELLNQAEILFALDYNRFNRTGERMGKNLENFRGFKVLIDHHIDPDGFADLAIWDTDASSTAQLVWEFIQLMGHAKLLDEPMATALYTGIMTDTGSFRFKTCTAHTHRIVAKLLEAGANGDWIHQQVYDQNSLNRLQLLGYALGKIKVLPKQKSAYLVLSQKELNRFSYKPGDTEGLVNRVLSIKGAEIAVLLTEKDGSVRFSFRSVGDFSVNDLARDYFNGGGHKHAAGGTLDVSLEDAVDYLENHLISLF